MGRVHSHVHLLPFGIVEVFAYADALKFADQIRVKIQLSVGELEAEEGVSLAYGYEAVAQGCAELHVKLVALGSIGRDLDV